VPTACQDYQLHYAGHCLKYLGKPHPEEEPFVPVGCGPRGAVGFGWIGQNRKRFKGQPGLSGIAGGETKVARFSLGNELEFRNSNVRSLDSSHSPGWAEKSEKAALVMP